MTDNLTPAAAPRMSTLKRNEHINRLQSETFDLAVVGGGITGAGIALDARSRGISVALVEKSDFASGTSSRSSKLIHGGLRYLEHLEFSLVREALRERETLSRLAPHLSRPLAFLVPLYRRGLQSPLGSNKLKLRLGLTLYDLLAGGRNVGRHRWLAPGEALKLAPALDSQGLRGAFLYYDCLTDDARLVVEVIKAAAAMSAVVANYAAARSITRLDDNSYRIEVEDVAAARSVTLRARVVVNATGVWADSVARLSDASAPRRLRPSKGIHIVVPSEKLNNRTAVLIPSLGEQRFLFVIPWLERTLIGTTDTDYDGDLDDPEATREETSRVLQSAARMFPGADLTEADCISTFAGLRPLVGGDKSTTANLSRKEELFESESGLITIIGGKLTTYRRMAERAVDLAARKLENKFRMNVRSLTERIELAGGRLERDVKTEAEQAASDYGVSVDTAIHLMETYGGNFRAVLEIASESEELRNPLAVDLPHIEAEVIYAARAEMAVTVEDFLSRRTRIALLAPDHGRSCATRVAALMGRELGWSSNEAQEALASLSL
ncbi:MAG TPA: glycerol-3-phosphate dehydrogenase [Blastocatellia bacterium]|nr:glycerol-3-phosphate dehydrogenase [Blastocatellia bacterium]